MKNKEVYRTIRIYEADADLLSKKHDKTNNWAEVINELVNKVYRSSQ